MTDISAHGAHVHQRLGTSATYEDGVLAVSLDPKPEVLHHGVVRISVLSFMVDVVGAIPIDSDPDVWAFTTDMSVRARPVPAPASIRAVGTTLRQGGRSATCAVSLTDDAGHDIGSAAIGFTTVPRRAGDPPKPAVSPERAHALVGSVVPLSRPLREEAGIVVVDAAAGVVEAAVTRELRNPAGTLQGAIVALIAEAAAEEVASSRLGGPAVVTDLDLRYLAQTSDGPVRTSARVLGDQPGAPIEVLLTDRSSGRVTTHAYARAEPPR